MKRMKGKIEKAYVNRLNGVDPNAEVMARMILSTREKLRVLKKNGKQD